MWSRRNIETAWGPDRRRGLTLIEMIGLLAIITILAAVLLPRVMGALARGRVSSTAQALGGLRSAVNEYLVRTNTLPLRAGYDSSTPFATAGRFDADLLKAGLIDRLFTTSMASQGDQNGGGCSASANLGALLESPHVRCAAGGASDLEPVTNMISSVNFDLDRNGTGDLADTVMVVYAYLPGVPLTEAVQLNQLLDGDAPTAGTAELAGRCIQSAVGDNRRVTVYVYLGHR